MSVLAALSQFVPFGNAQLLSYITSVITECYDPSEPGIVSVTRTVPVQSQQGTVTYGMPACDACDCPTCTVTSVFTTTLPIFCTTGVSQQPYTVTETYVGMSSLPNFATPTTVPYGFTVTEATCTVCDTTPLVTSMTFPSGCSPYATEPASEPTAIYPTLGSTSLNDSMEATSLNYNTFPTSLPTLPSNNINSIGPSASKSSVYSSIGSSRNIPLAPVILTIITLAVSLMSWIDLIWV